MNISALSALLAPQTTGHPQGLPNVTHPVRSDTRVAAMSPEMDTQNSAMQSFTHQRRAPHPRNSDGGQPDTAPPTILQLKIDEILQEQAEALAREAKPPSDARPDPVQASPAQSAPPASPASDTDTAPETDKAAETQSDKQTEFDARMPDDGADHPPDTPST